MVNFEVEVRKYNVNKVIPLHENSRIDEWWCDQGGKFPLLSNLSVSLLSIFHGPEVERNFSLMSQTLNAQTSSLDVATVNAIQTVKYFMKAEKTTSCSRFLRKDILHYPVPKLFAQKMQNASKQRDIKREEKKNEKQEALKGLSIKQRILSKAEQKSILLQAAAKARKRHIKRNLNVLANRKTDKSNRKEKSKRETRRNESPDNEFDEPDEPLKKKKKQMTIDDIFQMRKT